MTTLDGFAHIDTDVSGRGPALTYIDALCDLIDAMANDDAIALEKAAQWFIDSCGKLPISQLEQDYARRLQKKVPWLA